MRTPILPFGARMVRSRLEKELQSLSTEKSNLETATLSELSTRDILKKINSEDLKVPVAVGKEIPNIARAVDSIIFCIRNYGRLFYVGD